ncbi:hypothetical protein [Streptomyces sp. NPDC096351]|uniref:hypothetical protein n=1 Tax=Streptomyces sp. NPDC096351 TaxID=3366087 RepID=UPI00380AFB56
MSQLNFTRGTRWRIDPDPADGHPWSERPYVIVPFARPDEYRGPEGIDYDARHRLRARHRRRRAGRRKGVTP